MASSPAKALLDADKLLRCAANEFNDAEDSTLNDLRKAALDFADAWRACEGKGRP